MGGREVGQPDDAGKGRDGVPETVAFSIIRMSGAPEWHADLLPANLSVAGTTVWEDLSDSGVAGKCDERVMPFQNGLTMTRITMPAINNAGTSFSIRQ